ncbi:MAG: cardiolipin synthase [Tissierella sp.]|uniref:cardiolipin synthase n=1 Tax=Tissierella sp. TaxID=41274 RepID=UPI003F9E5847
MKNIIDNYLLLTSSLLWINIILAFLLVIFERKNPTSTWLWIMVLTFIPVLGFVLYLFIGQDLSRQRIFKVKKEEDSFFRNIAREQKNQISEGEFKLKNPNLYRYRDLIKMHLMNSESYYTDNNTVDLYFSGEEKFKALLKSLRSAKNYIHIEYYIFKNDDIGSKVIEILKEKAREGVKVRLLIDGMGGRKINKNTRKSIIDSGVELAVFFPPFVPWINVRINYRNHRKICIIDGKEAFMGGFNIGDEYLGRSKKFGNWRDTHIKIKGSAISSLQWRFFLDWRFAAGEEIKSSQSYLHEIDENNNVGIQIVSSGPDSKWPSIKDGYMKMISDARDKLYIETPYFIPDESIFEALRLAGLSGVDVRIMIPNKPDHPFVYWASMSYVGDLLEAGVKVYTYENGFLHSKVMVADEAISSVGTANLDIRSFRLNFEVNSFIYDQDVNKKLTNRFIKDLDLCTEITMRNYEKRSKYIKFKESFSRLLSPML